MSIKKLKEKYLLISKYNTAATLLEWDFETHMPKKAAEKRAEVIGEISSKAFEISISDEMGELLENADKEELNEVEKAIIKVGKKEYEKFKKIPKELFKEMNISSSKAQSAWEEAKLKNNFNIFKPYLEKVVALTKKMADYLGYEENRYDALLDLYEPGLKTSELRKVIEPLRSFLVEYLNKLDKGKKTNNSILKEYFPIEKQKELSLRALKLMKYDFDAGRMDISMHPFTTTIGPNDVRITTRYNEKDLNDSLYSTIHEGGHALYEQGIPEGFSGLPIGDGASMAIHESQSRFWENIIGRSLEFWKYFYNDLVDIFPEFKNHTPEEIFKAVNYVERSFIRTEADEVTYNLHIMLRFEIEEALINDKIKVEDLPKIWNEKMKEYLGVVPENDSEGVLQDVHWAHGSFGYFPSYMLGNLYSAQFYNKMKKDIPDLNEQISNGNFEIVLNWLREKIHSKGKMYEPGELVEIVTGEPLSSKYFIEYIENKFNKVYEL
ncbi:carboxypeptidase Taq [Marinitoga hydrogenitolerans DSM 16785]|uniref:Metal-dependent carboxypeptidase n=1 Tax=Marinitoga hydrogenitolerans (strain DSM 16785 / JCM 12826 / AT1271) TaxID=1122195 RepID=A0A1M4UTI7_MARH1|nr:carboxypeptidase M32 [Marinitoga hydrogenitolerans]SHE59967.1 carboxypeptidase Taq [Marinitoga hydrogenitolerans DSM 16785]